MKRWCVGVVICLAVLGSVSASCAKTEYDPTASYAAYKTYKWMTPKQVVGVKDTAGLDQAVKAAVDGALAAKGFVKTDGAQADFLLGYHAIVEKKTEEFMLDTRYDDMQDAFYERVAPYAGLGAEKRKEVYNVGTLIIDITDGKTNNLVWRCSEQARLNEKRKPAERERRLNDAVKKMLSNFPPNKR
ncbi:MAG TPA: DUF4136 domain-containing protein [bacterium]|nr:DUF4136 domain-containing protein [bacterium]